MCRDFAPGDYRVRTVAMQKVEGSSPFSRFRETPGAEPKTGPQEHLSEPSFGAVSSR
jgi:hypothetical protein